MLRDQFSSIDYDDLTLDQRVGAMIEAREMARADIEQHRVGLIPFIVGDPRRDAYLSIIRAEKGQVC